MIKCAIGMLIVISSILPAYAISGGLQYYVSGSDFQMDTTCTQGDIIYSESFINNQALSYVQGNAVFGSDFSVSQESMAVMQDLDQGFTVVQSLSDSNEDVKVETDVSGCGALASFSSTASLPGSKFNTVINAQIVDVDSIIPQLGYTQTLSGSNEISEYTASQKYIKVEQTGYGKDSSLKPTIINQKISLSKEGQISLKMTFQLTEALSLAPANAAFTLPIMPEGEA